MPVAIALEPVTRTPGEYPGDYPGEYPGSGDVVALRPLGLAPSVHAGLIPGFIPGSYAIPGSYNTGGVSLLTLTPMEPVRAIGLAARGDAVCSEDLACSESLPCGGDWGVLTIPLTPVRALAGIYPGVHPGTGVYPGRGSAISLVPESLVDWLLCSEYLFCSESLTCGGD